MQPKVENPCNQRLLTLLLAGYSIKLPESIKDTLDLRHPSRRRISAGHSALYLLPDGSVLTTQSDENGLPITISADDDLGFHALISRIPSPTWWEINHAKIIDRFVQFVLCTAFVIVVLITRKQ